MIKKVYKCIVCYSRIHITLSILVARQYSTIIATCIQETNISHTIFLHLNVNITLRCSSVLNLSESGV